MKVLILIPAYNESQNIVRVVASVQQQCPQFDYVVINDGSSDRTAAICYEERYNCISLPTNLGLSACVQTGMIYAYEHGYDYAVQLDGDGQHSPRYIEAMLENALVNDADIVIGSRFAPMALDAPTHKPYTLRMLGSNLIQLAIQITTGRTITDPTSGMRLYNRKVLREYAYNLNYALEPDTLAFLINNGIFCTEIRVEMSERIAGESYFNFKNALVYMIKMLTSILVVQWFRKPIKLIAE